MSRLLPFLALLLAAPVAGQEEAAAPVVEAAPEPPRKLQEALRQLKDKDWALASLSLHAVLQDADAAPFHADVRYFLGFALEQMGLNYSALEEYNRFLLTAAPASEVLDKGIKRAIALAQQLDAGWLVGEGLAAIDTSAVTAGFQGPAMRWAGAWHYDQGQFPAARAFFKLVPAGTDDYAQAKMLEGIALVREGKGLEAIAPLATAVQASRGRTLDNTWEIANLNLGRLYYALGNFERAIEHLEMTPRSSPLWFESLYEASWAYFRMGRLSGALSHLQTIDSPFFDATYHPDATLLRTLIFYYLCKYLDGQDMLDEFTEQHYPISKEIKEAIARADGDPAGLFTSLYAWVADRKAAGIALPEPVKQHFAPDAELLRIGDYLRGLDGELATADAIRSGWEKSRLKAELTAHLQQQKQDAQARKGQEALVELRRMVAALDEHLGNAELYKVEMITAEKDVYDAAFRGAIAEKVAARKSDPAVPDGYEYWPFQGEYWIDEIGWYEVNTIDECLQIKR